MTHPMPIKRRPRRLVPEATSKYPYSNLLMNDNTEIPESLTSPAKVDKTPTVDCLDPGYVFRKATFFTVGKVLATVVTEAIGQHLSDDSTNVTTVIFGQRVYSHIAQFVVVQVGKGFFYGCPITTYGNQGTLRKGCNPGEHAIIHLVDNIPALVPGEPSLSKQAIAVQPTSAHVKPFAVASRVRFGRGQALQSNIKAKEIGTVIEEHIPVLVSYWRNEMGMDSVTLGNIQRKRPATSYDPGDGENQSKYVQMPTEVTQTVDPSPSATQRNATSERRYDLNLDGIGYTMFINIGATLHSGFDIINKPKAFFKRGRVFMALWPDLTVRPDVQRGVHLKIRRFVVIRPKATHCLSLPIYTYRGQGTTKSGIVAEEHAAVVPTGGDLQICSGENIMNKPLYIKVEDQSINIDPMSRLNFASVSTVQYSLRVRNVGRLVAESTKQLEEYFVQSMRLDK